MKKLLILLFAAAVIGVVISKVRGSGAEGPQAVAAGAEPAVAVAAVPGRPEAALPPAPVARPVARLDARRPAQGPPSPPAGKAVAEAPKARPALAAPAPAPRATAVPQGPPTPEALVVRVKKVQPAASTAQPPRPQVNSTVAAAIARASSLMQEGRRVEARKILSDLYLESRGETARRLRVLLDEISKDLTFNPRCTEGAKIHVVQAGETLTKIGKEYGQSWQMIQRVNGMTHDRINVGQQLKILDGEVNCIVVLSEFRLTMLIGGVYAKEYPIGIGTDDKTPTAEFVVDTMLVNPRWYKPGGGVVEYGEEGHLLGERWIGFADQPGAAGLGIHGTNDESTIGTKCSNGCLRMRRDDVIELYDFLRRGSKIVVKD